MKKKILIVTIVITAIIIVLAIIREPIKNYISSLFETIAMSDGYPVGYEPTQANGENEGMITDNDLENDMSSSIEEQDYYEFFSKYAE